MEDSSSFDALPDGSLALTLDGCCIQTAAKQAHRDLVATLLEEARPALHGGLVTLLEEFLMGTDFSALRASRPELAGGTRCHVRLWRRNDGHVGWDVTKAP